MEFLKQLDIDNRDTLKVVREEFDDYLRATNDTELHPELESIAKGLKDDFARSTALSCLNSFLALRSKLGTITVEQFSDRTLLFRAQLLRATTSAIEASENKMLFSGWDVVVAGIPVLDAAVLRMLTAEGSREGCNLTIFCTPKQYDGLYTRLKKTGTQFEDKTGGRVEVELIPQAKAIRGDAETKRPVLLAAPDRRREILNLAEGISDLFSKGVQPSEILVVARDSGSYQTLANSILPAYGIPVHVQTRQLESLLSQTQMVVSVLRLFTKVSRDEEIEWNELTDPIRLGVCLTVKRDWPLKNYYFIRLEEVLAKVQRDKERKGLKLDEWIAIIPTSDVRLFDELRKLAQEYLDWVKRSAAAPSSSSNAISILREFLGNYVYNRTVWTRESLDPRVEHPERFRLDELHPTEHAARIRRALKDVQDYFTAAEKAKIITSIAWDQVLTAFTDVVVSSTFGLPLKDLNTVRFVDAGNTSFLEAKHLFVVGMMADEFPRKHTEGKLLGEDLRRAISVSGEGKSGFLYLPSPETDYDTDRDYLTTTLATTTEDVTCSMAYLDESGHQVEWSPFVSHLTRELAPMQPGDWLPNPTTTWKALVEKEPRWINWRLFSYHQYRKPLADPDEKVTLDDISEVAARIDPGFFSGHLGPRISQYVDPPTSITVSATEKWFDPLTLEAVAGPPFSSYELDLHATCPFQFYFYQFLYLRRYDTIDRRTIPFWYWIRIFSPGVPRRLAGIYPSNETDKALAKVISLLPSRQQDLLALTSDKSLRDLLLQNLNVYEARRVRASLASERNLAYQETSEVPPLKRDWEWVEGGKEVKIENSSGSARVILPPHRLDRLTSSSLILAYVHSSQSLQGLVYRNVIRGGQVYDPRVEDPLLDYRLAVLMSHYLETPIAGALFVGLDGEARQGYYNDQLIPEHKGRFPYSEELQMPIRLNRHSREQVLTDEGWDRRVERFQDAVIARSDQMTPSSMITYTATAEPNKCRRCVFYSLCHIPRAKGM